MIDDLGGGNKGKKSNSTLKILKTSRAWMR